MDGASLRSFTSLDLGIALGQSRDLLGAKDKAGILVLGALGTLSGVTAAFCKIGVWQSSKELSLPFIGWSRRF